MLLKIMEKETIANWRPIQTAMNKRIPAAMLTIGD